MWGLPPGFLLKSPMALLSAGPARGLGWLVSCYVPIIPADSSLSSPHVGPMSKIFLRELTGKVRARVGETRRCSVSSWGSLSPNTLIFPLLTSHPWGSLQPCKRQMASPHSPNGLWRQGSIFAVMGGGEKGWLLALRALQLPRAVVWAWCSLGTSGHSHLPHERFFIFFPLT